MLNQIQAIQIHCNKIIQETDFKSFDVYSPKEMKPFYCVEEAKEIIIKGTELLVTEQNLMYLDVEPFGQPYNENQFVTQDGINFLFKECNGQILTQIKKMQDYAEIGKFQEALQINTELCQIFSQNQQKQNQNFQPSTPSVEQKVVVVSDLHGSFSDLFRIIQLYGEPGELTKYCFMGDYVDRGPFGLEILLFLVQMKLTNPNNVVLLRGNHEADKKFKFFTHLDEMKLKYNNDQQLIELINKLFVELPLCCLINKKYFLSHASFPHVQLEQVQEINRRQLVVDQTQKELYNILWGSRQLENQNKLQFEVQEKEALNQLIMQNNIKLMFRGHEFKRAGFELSADKNILTLFSISNYGQFGQCCVGEIYGDQVFVRRVE